MSFAVQFITRQCNTLRPLPLENVKLTVLLCSDSLDDMLKAASNTAETLKECPSEADSIHCPFNKYHGLPIFSWYAKHPAYAGRFARAMAGATRSMKCFPIAPHTCHTE